MHFTPLSFGIGTAGRAPVAVLCGVLVAACDTGSTVSPNTTSTATDFPTTASAAVAPGGLGNLIITTVDVHQKLIGGATFKILAPNLVVGFVSDNDAMDRDSTLGKIHLKALPIGNHTVCEIVPPAGYALPDWDCHPTTVYSGQTTGAEAFVSDWRYRPSPRKRGLLLIHQRRARPRV